MYGLYQRQGLLATACLAIFMPNAGEGSVLRQAKLFAGQLLSLLHLPGTSRSV